ncbi:MAG: hypothetical protein E7505_02745 [Ruminococcus sp.]|nr:hypothetical protein [Ruminococcus sp.]
MKLRKLQFLMMIALITLLASCSSNKEHTEHQKDELYAQDKSSEYELIDTSIFDTQKLICNSVYGETESGFLICAQVNNIIDNIDITGCSLSDGRDVSEFSLPLDESYGDLVFCRKTENNIYIIFRKNDVFSLKMFDTSKKLINETEIKFNPVDFILDDLIYIVNYYDGAISVSCYDYNLSLINSSNIGYEADSFMFPQKITVSENGDIYCLMYNKFTNEYVIASDDNASNHLYTKINDLDNIDSLFCSSSGNLFVCGKGEGYYMIDEISPHGDIVNMYETPDCDAVYGVSGSEFICGSDSAVFAYNYENETKKTLISPDKLNDKEIISVNTIENNIELITKELSDNSYSALIETNSEGDIIREYPVNNLQDCFVSDTKIYYIARKDELYKLYTISDGIQTETKISYPTENKIYYRLAVDENNRIVIYTSNEQGDSKLDFYDSDYSFIQSKSIESLSSFLFHDNRLYYTDNLNLYYTDNELNICKSDIDFNIFGSNPTFSQGNDEYSFLFSNDEGVFGYKSDIGKYDKLLDFYKEGTDKLSRTFFLNNKSELIMCNSYSLFKAVFQNASEKEIINIAVFPDELYSNDSALIFDAVEKFNHTSEKYKIDIKPYKDSGENDAAELFDRDIITGNIPDAVCLNKKMNLQTYIKNNTFTDLYTYIDKDNEINRQILQSNVLDAFEYNEELYYLPLTYMYNTVITNIPALPASLSEYADIILNAENFEYCSSSGICPKEPFCNIYLSEHILPHERLPELSEDQIFELVSFINERLDFEVYELDEYPDFFTNGSKLFANVAEFGNILSFSSESQKYNAEYNVGYTSSCYGLVIPQIGFSLCENSPHKDAVWDFIKILMTIIENDIENNVCAYIKTEYNEKYYDAEISPQTSDLYSEITKATWKSDFMTNDICSIIISETDKNSETTITESDSRKIHNKLKLYMNEIS